MSTTISSPAGFFWNDGVSPTSASDLQSTLDAVTASVTAATAASAAAVISAAAASASASSALSASTSAIANVNAAVTTATATINASVTAATTTLGADATSAAASASGAVASASTATTKATAASSSATAAGTSASASVASATAAAGSATTAATNAGNASTSNTAAGVSATAAAVSASSAATSAAAISAAQGFRNAIINGGFGVWQRGTTVTPTGAGYSADMVIASANGTGGAVSVSQVVLSPTDAPVAAGLQYAYQYVVTGAPTGGTFRNIILPVEGVRTFAGKTVRLTFWAHADATRAVGLSIITFPGTGGSPSGGVGISGGIMTVAATTTWQQFTTTFVMPAASTLTPGTNADGSIRVFFSLPLNTTMAIALAGVQLEIDTGAVTPFENRPPAVEMALCQRYFQSLGWAIFGYNTAGSVVSVCVGFNAAMRTLPTLVGTTNSTSNASATTFNTLGVTGCQPFVTATATGSVGAFGTLTASAEL